MLPLFLLYREGIYMWRYKEQDLGKFPDCCALTDTGRCSWLTLANVVAVSA